MKTKEQIQNELEQAGLKVERDATGNLRGVLTFQYSRLRDHNRKDRGYVYPVRDGEAWGWLSEDVVLWDKARDKIEQTYPNISRGSDEDEPVVGNDRPELIINGGLMEFVRMIQIFVYPGIVLRRQR